MLNGLMQRFTQERAEAVNSALNPTGSLQHINRKLAAEANCGSKSIFFEPSVVLSHDSEMIQSCDAIVAKMLVSGTVTLLCLTVCVLFDIREDRRGNRGVLSVCVCVPAQRVHTLFSHRH